MAAEQAERGATVADQSKPQPAGYDRDVLFARERRYRPGLARLIGGEHEGCA